MKRLVQNTAINFAAFGLVSLTGLALVPVLVGTYGLELFGLIVLARLLLPTGIMGLFDLGLPNAAIRHIAHAGASGDQAGAERVLSGALLLSLLPAVIVALVVVFGAAWISSDVLSIAPARLDSFSRLVAWTGLALLPLYPGLVVEGALKGLERFAVIRAAEVAAALANAAGVVTLVLLDAPYQAVAYLYLLTQLCRIGFLVLVALTPLAGGVRFRWRRPDRASLKETLLYGRAMVERKVVDILFTFGPGLVIANQVGAAGVGAYDVLMRLPRFAKITSGLATSALLPFSTKLDSHDRDGALQRIVTQGSRFSLTLFAPPLLVGAAFGGDILRHWLGPDYADLGAWLSLAFLWPLIAAWHHIGGSAIASRRHAVHRSNLINLGQLVLFLVVALTLLGSYAERAFILALPLAVAVAAPFHITIICREYGVSRLAFLRLLLGILLAGIPAAGLAGLVLWQGWSESLAGFLAFFALCCGLYWACITLFVLAPADRQTLRSMLRVVLGQPLQAPPSVAGKGP